MNGPGDSPYKGFAPLSQVPGCHEPRYVHLDFLHIYHIGYGLDAAASSIVLLCKLGHFGQERKLDDRLAEAYVRFDMWCSKNRKTSSIEEFSQKAFAMTGVLGVDL